MPVEAKQVGKMYENRIIFVEHPHVSIHWARVEGKTDMRWGGTIEDDWCHPLSYLIEEGYYLSWSRTIGLLSYLEFGGLSFGVEGIYSCVGRSGDQGLRILWH